MSTKLRHGTPEEAGMLSSRIQRARNLAESWYDQELYTALVILVARRGTIVLEEVFGHLTPEPDSPVLELNSIFPLTSQSKIITATAAMVLVEDGLISLNHPVVDYIPEFAGEGKDKVMIHHLLTHTSGLTEKGVEEKYEKQCVESSLEEQASDSLWAEFMSIVYDVPLSWAAGKEMAYCDENFDLMGEIIERVSGMAFDRFCKERIFEPLGMKDSYFETPEHIKPRIVGHPADNFLAQIIETMSKTRTVRDIVIELPSGGAGAISTAVDMVVFGQTFLNGGIYGDNRILSPISVSEMTRNQIPGTSAKYGEEYFSDAVWGLGWNIKGSKKSPELSSSRSFRHGGAGTVSLWVDPVYDIVGAIFSVSASPNFYRQTSQFINVVTAAVVDV